MAKWDWLCPQLWGALQHERETRSPSHSPRRASAGAGNDISEQLHRWSLHFRDIRSEEAFVRSRELRVAKQTLPTASVGLAFLLGYWAVEGFEVSTGLGAFEKDDPVLLIASRTCIHLVMAATLMLLIGILLVQRAHRKWTPMRMESWIIKLCCLVSIFGSFQRPLFLACLLGGISIDSFPGSDDITQLQIVLVVNVLLLAIHLVLPFRWSNMIFLDGCVCLTLSLSTWLIEARIGLQHVVFHTIVVWLFFLVMALQQRSHERGERDFFLRVAQEKTLRAQAEFRLANAVKNSNNTVSSPSDSRGKVPEPEMDVATGLSVPQSTATGKLFHRMHDLDEATAKRRLHHISELGLQEHWMISPSDLKVHTQNVIGAGGFGLVVTASYHGALVAVKAPKRAEAQALGRTMGSIVHELRMFRRLRHPNIVLFYGACLVPETHEVSLVLEYVAGEPLNRYVKEPYGPSGKLERWTLASDVCCALRYLHAQLPAIVHGDIKGSNALVERLAAAPRTKLVDFGLSTLLTQNPRPLGGTLKWRAPETLVAGARPSSAADIFSYGRLLYMVATGLGPLSDWHMDDVTESLMLGYVPEARWPESPLTAEFRPLHDACTRQEPQSRPKILEVFEKLEEILASWTQGKALVTLHDGLSPTGTQSVRSARSFRSARPSTHGATVAAAAAVPAPEPAPAAASGIGIAEAKILWDQEFQQSKSSHHSRTTSDVGVKAQL